MKKDANERQRIRIKSMQCLLCNVLFEYLSPLPLVCFMLFFRLSKTIFIEFVAQQGFEPSQRALSTEKRAWNHEIMAILSKKSSKLRILGSNIRTKCVPNKLFLNFRTFLQAVCQSVKTIYHCLGQAQIDGFSFF